jgi:hypothetical protein
MRGTKQMGFFSSLLKRNPANEAKVGGILTPEEGVGKTNTISTH